MALNLASSRNFIRQYMGRFPREGFLEVRFPFSGHMIRSPAKTSFCISPDEAFLIYRLSRDGLEIRHFRKRNLLALDPQLGRKLLPLFLEGRCVLGRPLLSTDGYNLNLYNL